MLGKATFRMPLAALAAGLFLAAGAGAQNKPTLDQMTVTGLTDFQATVAVVKADQTELAKINRDFAMAYRLKDLVMRYKEPNKLRMEGRIGVMIINGSSRVFRVPQLHLNRKDDLGAAPGQRHSLLDVGLLTKAGLAGTQAQYLRADSVDGTAAVVFDVTYKGDASCHYLLWMDPARKIVLRRDWLDGAGKPRASFLYQQAHEVKPGLWVPMRIEIRTGEGTVAGVTAYSDLKVNQGLDDSLFKTSTGA